MQKIIYWIKLSRPKTLIASISPVMISSIFCYNHTPFFKLNIFFTTLIAAMLIQILTNFINDLYDWKKGSDTPKRLGPERMVAKGFLNEKEVMKAIYFVCCLSLIIGLYLVIKGGLIILLVGVTSLIFAYLYTATSFSIAYNGYGDFFVFLYFGLIASIGTIFLQTNSCYYEGFLIGCIAGCLNVALLVVNNIRDVKEDSITNKKTLIVKFGVLFGKIEFVFMMIAPYFFIYQLLNLLNKQILFYSYSALVIFGIVLIYRIFNSKSFLESKALKHLSTYMILLTVLLAINL